MANTYSQIHIHSVFSTKYRRELISPLWEDELYKYISGTFRKKYPKLIAINGMPDHIHLLFGMRPEHCISDIIRDIKKSSTTFIQETKYLHNFQWQGGFGAFSHSKSELPRVIEYIMNQKKHHKSETFENEYRRLLFEHNVDFDEKYLFD